MTNRRRTQPFSHEAIVAVLEERLEQHSRSTNERLDLIRIALSEIDSKMGGLESRERERNGQIARITVWMTDHQALSNAKIADLDELTKQHHDSNVRAAVYRQWWVLLLAGVGAGAGVVEALNRLGFIG